MYGTLSAAGDFQAELSEQMITSLEFDQGLTTPCIFRWDARELDVCVHGDDVIAVGIDEQLTCLGQH